VAKLHVSVCEGRLELVSRASDLDILRTDTFALGCELTGPLSFELPGWRIHQGLAMGGDVTGVYGHQSVHWVASEDTHLRMAQTCQRSQPALCLW
jgi:hypothetical protein